MTVNGMGILVSFDIFASITQFSIFSPQMASHAFIERSRVYPCKRECLFFPVKEDMNMMLYSLIFFFLELS